MPSYTFLKVIHNSLDEAKKLRPFIKESTAICIESAYSSVASSEHTMQLYARYRNSSRTAFKKNCIDVEFVSPNTPKSQKYVDAVKEDIWRNRGLLVMQEWWEERETEELIRQDIIIRDLTKLEKLCIIQGKADDAERACTQSWQLMKKLMVMRDKHIAEQLPLVSQRIKKFYGVDTINDVVLIIGASHNVEKYVADKVTVHSLVDEATLSPISKVETTAANQDLSLEETIRMSLISASVRIAQQVEIPYSIDTLLSLNINKLKEWISLSFTPRSAEILSQVDYT